MIFGFYNNHNRDETTLFPPPPLSLSSFLSRLRKGRRDIPPRRDRYGIIESSQFIYLHRVCMCIYDCLYVVYLVYTACVEYVFCVYVCCMLLSVYNTFTIITIRCSSSTIHLNSRMYTFIFIIFIYIIRKKV